MCVEFKFHSLTTVGSNSNFVVLPWGFGDLGLRAQDSVESWRVPCPVAKPHRVGRRVFARRT